MALVTVDLRENKRRKIRDEIVNSLLQKGARKWDDCGIKGDSEWNCCFNRSLLSQHHSFRSNFWCHCGNGSQEDVTLSKSISVILVIYKN